MKPPIGAGYSAFVSNTAGVAQVGLQAIPGGERVHGIAECLCRASVVVGTQCDHQRLWGNDSKSVHDGSGAM